MKPGDRVRLKRRGLSNCQPKHTIDRLGTVQPPRPFGRQGSRVVYVLWDGRCSMEAYNPDLLELVSDEN